VGEEPTYIRRYLVDSLSGLIKSNLEYFTYHRKELKQFEVTNLIIDSSRHVPKTELLENPSDSLIIHFRTARSNFDSLTFSSSL